MRASTGSRLSAARTVELLVGGDVLDEPEELWSERRLWQRLRPVPPDAGRHLDDVVGRQSGERLAVADVDLVHGAVARRERRDQAECGLAVERAAALHEEVGPLVDRGIAVDVEQALFDLLDDGRPRLALELLAQHGVVRVEVAEVVRRDRSELVEQPAWQLDLVGELVTVLGEQGREHVRPVEQHTPHPCEVIEADLIDNDTRRLDAEPACELALESDGHVAEPDGSVAAVEQCPRDDAHRVREVDDPGVRLRERANPFGDVEDDRDSPHRLREAAGSGRLLPDAAAGERQRLVAQPRVLATDPDLDQDEIRVGDRSVEIAGHLEPAVVSLPGEHPPRHSADDLAPFGVDVLEHDLVDVQAREAGHELWRVRGAPADDSDLHSG